MRWSMGDPSLMLNWYYDNNMKGTYALCVHIFPGMLIVVLYIICYWWFSFLLPLLAAASCHLYWDARFQGWHWFPGTTCSI